MMPTGTVIWSQENHLVAFSLGANLSTQTGMYTEKVACVKPIRNLVPMSVCVHPVGTLANTRTDAMLMSKVEDRMYFGLRHLKNSEVIGAPTAMPK